MSDDRHALIDTLIAKELDVHGDLAPPWARYPEIPNGSIGWRMGGGEGWLMMWWQWLARLPTDRAVRLAYLRRHPPAPRSWTRSAMSVIDPDFEDDFEDEGDDEVADALDERRRSLRSELEQAGVLVDDAAIGAWLLRNDPPRAPWVGEGSVAGAVRYGARALNFFVRWAVARRAEGRLASWLEAVPPPPRGWRAVHDALASGRAPAALPRDAREQLAILLAAQGDPPPPWTRGEPPAAIEQQFEEDTTYAGAWSEWATDSFDDASSWTAYLGRCVAAPPEWDQVIRAELPWMFRDP